jgi:hypothetical protein
MLASKKEDIPSKLEPVKGEPLHFKAPYLFANKKDGSLLLEPFYEVHDARYMMYWMVLTDPSILERLKKEQEEALALDEKTVDKVAPGEQQPEVDHQMKTENTTSGTANGEFYRDAGKCNAGDGGSISYVLETNSEDSLSLMVRYWGNESCSRTFDIMIDGEKLATESIEGKWNKKEFVNEIYAIPDAMIKGKKEVRVTFKAGAGNMVGGLYGVRLLRNKPKPEVKDSVPSAIATPARMPARPDLKARVMGGELQIVSGTALSQGFTARIFAMDGRLVKSEALPAGQSSFSIGIGDMKNGMYILKIQRDGYSYASTIFRKGGF